MKKVLVTLLGLFGAPIGIRRPGNCAPLAPRRFAPELAYSFEMQRGVLTVCHFYIAYACCISHKYNVIVCVSMTSPCSLSRSTTLK